MYHHPANNSAYQSPYPQSAPQIQQVSFIRPPPGLNVPPRTPSPEGTYIAPPPGIPLPQHLPSMAMPKLPPGIPILQAPVIALPQPPGTPIPPPPGFSKPQSTQSQPDMPQPEPPMARLEPLEASQRHVQQIIDSMNKETMRLKQDRAFQDVLFSNGLLYTTCPNAWNTCDCEFCIGIRYIRQYKNLDAIGERLWGNPEYAFWREFPNTHGCKECKCEDCAKLEQKEKKVEVPDVLEPDWTLWYGPGGRPKLNGQSSGVQLDELQQPPKFRGRPAESQGQSSFADSRAEAMLREYLSTHGAAQPLVEMPRTEVQQYNNASGTVKSNGVKTNGANHPLRNFILPGESTPDYSPHIGRQYGVVGQPAVKKMNTFPNGIYHSGDHHHRGPPR
ncbi:hypothetical protein TWF718_010161 [Orbilia javanica]|uniref:Uncharacterized protein n=1 Tax=Orbilia javanica TaxID=47235 RepID=A0AAN8MQ89_9PEZI